MINNLDGLTVVRDDDDPDPMRRYKVIAHMQDHRMGLATIPSDTPESAVSRWPGHAMFSGSTWTPAPTASTGPGGRSASLRTSQDWKKWSQLEVVFGKGSDPEFNKTFQWHGAITPFNYGNVEYLKHTPIRVAVIGPDGSPLPGYSLEESRIPVDNKRLYSIARWKTRPDLGELVGRQVSLHFEIRGAVVYSYRFHLRLA